MLINLRNALMAGKRLPYDAEVEYLEATGTQYIDTGSAIGSGFWFDAQIDLTGTDNNYRTLLGARIGSGNADYQYSFYLGYFLARYGTSNSQYYYTIQTGQNHIELTNERMLYVNGSLVQTLGYSDPSSNNLFIFALNNNGSVSQQAKNIRIYSLKYGDSNGQHDLIPVRKGTVGYLYDRVSGKLFGNAGTGDFVLGPDKN